MNTPAASVPNPDANAPPAILHICRREMLRPLRDQMLRLSGLSVESTLSSDEALSMFHARSYDLVLIDIDGDDGVSEAERLCSEVKTARREQRVAFVCNWRIAIQTECPDEVIRTEFDPQAFVDGVHNLVHKNRDQPE